MHGRRRSTPRAHANSRSVGGVSQPQATRGTRIIALPHLPFAFWAGRRRAGLVSIAQQMFDGASSYAARGGPNAEEHRLACQALCVCRFTVTSALGED